MIKVKNNFLTGALILVLCSIITKIIGAIYKIPLLKVLGSDGLGEYQMIISIYALFLVIASSGLCVTLSKLIARESAYHNKHNQKKYFNAGITISILISGVLIIMLISLSPIISKYQNSGNLMYCYFAIAPALIFSSLIGVFKGYFLGKRKMLYSGGVQIAEASLKLIFSLYLSMRFANNYILGAVFGAVLGITISEILCLCFMIALFVLKGKKNNNLNSVLKNRNVLKATYNFVFFKKDIWDNFTKKDKNTQKNDQKVVNINKKLTFYNKKPRYKTFYVALKDVIKISFFITLQACIFPLFSAIDGLVVVPLLLKTGISQLVAYSLFGIEDGVVSAIISMPTIVATSIGASIIPALKNSTNKDLQIKNALKIVWIVSVFCTMLFVFFSKEIIQFLYGSGLTSKTVNELGISADLLKLNGFNIIYICILSICTSILQGLDKSSVPVKNMLIASGIRFFVLFICLTNKKLNIYGLSIADMAFYSVTMILNIISIKKIINIKFKIKNILIMPIMSLAISLMSMRLTKTILSNILSFKITLAIIMLLGVSIYFLILSITKVFNVQDFVVLRKKQIIKN